MRSYLPKEEFFLKMKKKPAQQAVIDNIENYTEEQIEALPSNHFPRWAKDALIKLKARNGKTASSVAAEIAEKMNKYHQERIAK